MAVKQLLTRASRVLKFRSKSTPAAKLHPADQQADAESVLVRKKGSQDNRLELLQQGFTNLVSQLESINQSLQNQSSQNEKLISRIEHLPELIQTLPEAVKNQSSTVNALLGQLEQNQNKDLEFIRAVEAIPRETGKQTDALENIASQMSASAESDVLLAENFNRFKHSIEHLDRTSKKQIESMGKMDETFAASDRYMKYLISSHNRRFTALFIVSIVVMFISILAVVLVFAMLISKGIL